ncbi:hypothetical protein [Streptomyces cavernicola]|uniref:Uncharacterized protein n=1 Tax=Streptomyces cavernicola TaxID=3043613 RepID=A0ABT6S426_9ACTN|nr:hypothetical protein [Streptomyces sp. B-S-A6]MDI3402841.1 hypothetical protein [Streptomyces sp. B-S-A6]
MTEHVEGARLSSVVTRVLMTELFPGPQPRTGMEVMEVADPQVHGVTHDGQPSAALRYHYQDLEHLRNHVWQTIHGTLSINDYAVSILTRSVTRNLIVHPVEITFEDGTESLHVLAVRDGITRLASAWAVLAGPDEGIDGAAALAQKVLLGEFLGGPDAQKVGQQIAERRAQWRTETRADFDEEMQGEAPGPRAAQIAQSYVVPAQIAVGVAGHASRVLDPEDLFDDAIRSVLAAVHVEFKPWDDAAQNLEVITRALKRVIQLGDPRWDTEELNAVYGLAVGRLPVSKLPEVFGGETAPPGTALWRAVYLVSALTQPDLLELLKDQAKAIKGGQRMSMKGFGDLLGPIIDLPWRSHKKLVTKQARNAWKNGGVLSGDVTKGWQPVPTDDFTTLIEPAMAGDMNARCTLAVAGGVALISDKLLTRNVGSSLTAPMDKGRVPFRADAHLIVEGLSAPENELGLWTLARAANTFRSDDLPQNAAVKQSLTGKGPAESSARPPYIHFKVDLDAPDKIARDANGVPEMLYEWDVVTASDPDRARKLADELAKPDSAPSASYGTGPLPQTGPAGGEQAGDKLDGEGAEPNGAVQSGLHSLPDHPAPVPTPRPASRTLPPSQRAVEHRKTLRLNVQSARDALDQLHTLEPEVGSHTPIVPMDTLDELHELLIGIQTDVENLRRRIRDNQARDEQDSEDAAEEQDRVND